MQIEVVDRYDSVQLFAYWQSLGKTTPYFYPVDYDHWYDCLINDKRNGETIFKHTKEYVARWNDELVGFIQFGIPCIHYNSKGEVFHDPNIGVIRHLYFLEEYPEAGHRLMQVANDFFQAQGLTEIYAFYHAMGMSCNAHHGKLYQTFAHVESVLMNHGFAIEHENIFYHLFLKEQPIPRTHCDIRIVQQEQMMDSKETYRFIYKEKEIGGAEVRYLETPKVAYLNWIWIKQEYQGFGLGSSFIIELIAILTEKEYGILDTDTANNNLVAQAFYERNGFHRLGHSRSYLTIVP